MHEEYLDEDDSYWLIIDTKENNTIYSKCLEWDIDAMGQPNEWRLIDYLSEHGGFRGTVLQWGVPTNKKIASVCLESEEDEDEYGFGGDWWKQ